MKNIKFWNIPNIIKELNFDGDKKDLRLHTETNLIWSADTKKEYSKACKEIDKLEAKGNGWIIYCWYDVSGFEYWVKKQEEPNYIQVSISFDKNEINEEEINNIENALILILESAKDIADKYEYILF